MSVLDFFLFEESSNRPVTEAIAVAEEPGRQARILTTIANALARADDLDTIVKHVTDGARALCRAVLATVAVRDPESGVIMPRGGAHALDPGRSRFLALPETSPERQAVKSGLPVRSAVRGVATLVVPIGRAESIEGLISVARPSPFRDSDELELTHLAADAAIAIARLRAGDAARAELGEARRASRAREEFLAVVSHELRTPVTAVLGWVRLLRGGRLRPTQAARALHAIQRSAEMQARLISDLLDVSRIATGVLHLEPRGVLLAETVQEAVDAIRLEIDAKGVALRTRLDEVEAHVWGDPLRLRQIVMNLLTNAVTATPAGGRIEVVLERAGEWTRLTVSDTGVGIEPELLPDLFEQFAPKRRPKGRRPGGLGLGLAIVRHLSELHRGRVSADSAGKNQGAVFTVELPLLTSATAAVLSSEQPLDPPPMTPGDGLLRHEPTRAIRSRQRPASA
jgi:signal transduction histidine kinase